MLTARTPVSVRKITAFGKKGKLRSEHENAAAQEADDAPIEASSIISAETEDIKSANGPLGALGALVAVMAVIATFYTVVFYVGTSVFYQFKDAIAPITRKDFIPYSERKAMEAQLLLEREAQDSATQQAPALTGSPSSGGPSIRVDGQPIESEARREGGDRGINDVAQTQRAAARESLDFLPGK